MCFAIRLEEEFLSGSRRMLQEERLAVLTYAHSLSHVKFVDALNSPQDKNPPAELIASQKLQSEPILFHCTTNRQSSAWYLTPTAPMHACRDRHLFQSDFFEYRPPSIEILEKMDYPIWGHGSVDLTTTNREVGTIVLRLVDVFFVPDIPVNMISAELSHRCFPNSKEPRLRALGAFL
jgi:hypothetical protein